MRPMKNVHDMAEKSKEIFPSNKELRIRVKKCPINPYGSTIMQSFIDMCDTHPEYFAYIHEKRNYVRFRCSSRNMEPIRPTLDDRLWIELLLIFDFIEIIEKD